MRDDEAVFWAWRQALREVDRHKGESGSRVGEDARHLVAGLLVVAGEVRRLVSAVDRLGTSREGGPAGVGEAIVHAIEDLRDAVREVAP